MKRWFGGKQGSTEFSEPIVGKYQKKDDDKPVVLGSPTYSTAVPPQKKHVVQALLSVNESTKIEPAAIKLKETVVVNTKKAHRRQKSSGNWHMLLGETPQPVNMSTGSAETSGAPVRKPVSSKETTPLSFFQQISSNDNTLPKKTSPQHKTEIFPWNGNDSSAAAEASSSSEKRVDNGPTSTKPPEIPVPNSKDYVNSGNAASKTIEDTSAVEHTDISEATIGLSQTVISEHDKNDHTPANDQVRMSLSNSDRGGEQSPVQSESKSPLPLSASLSHNHLNTDSLAVRDKRRHLKELKRKSYPMSEPEGNSEAKNATRHKTGHSLDHVEVRCEVLKISDVETGAQQQTFVVLDPGASPQLPKGISKQIKVHALPENEPDCIAYNLAESTQETALGASVESLNSASEEDTPVAERPQTLSIPTMDTVMSAPSNSNPELHGQAQLKRKSFQTSLLDLPHATSSRSFDEISIGSDKRASNKSLLSSSTKSYSVNDLTLLERPSGFGTLDMKNLLGSLRMLDNIISEYATHTPDDESPPRLASPVSATIIISDVDQNVTTPTENTTIVNDEPLLVITDVPGVELTNISSPVGSSRSSGGPGSPPITEPAFSPATSQISQTSPTVRSEHSASQPSSRPSSRSSSRCYSTSTPEAVEVSRSARNSTSEADQEIEVNDLEAEDDELPPLISEQTLRDDDSDETVEEDSIEMNITFSDPYALPWGGRRRKITTDILIQGTPGECVMKKLFLDFTAIASNKVDQVMAELDKPLQKLIQLGEDSKLDQMISTLGTVAEHSLPSLLMNLFAWYDRQIGSKKKGTHYNSTEMASVKNKTERRELAISFLVCLVLVEVLKQLEKHPGYEPLIDRILALAFSAFKQNDNVGPNAVNTNALAELYAEVIGVLAVNRFTAVKKKFLLDMKELRSKENNAIVANLIMGLIMGLKFFRVKMTPILEFEACVHFLHDLGNIFIETQNKEIKQAMACLLVEILQPMASMVVTEVNVPIVRNFVEKMYPLAMDASTKKRNVLTMMPLITCLLTVSQKQFFFHHWNVFLPICLNQIKGRDLKMSRVALECLSRLVWVYTVRLGCESNQITNQRLSSISSVLYPRGGKTHIPKDSPLNIHVRLIFFIAMVRQDFAIKEIIFELLSCGKKYTNLSILPERMAIGLRAFLVISDALQSKNKNPPMPQTVGVRPSGGTIRMKKMTTNTLLTDDTAKHIGLHHYYPQIRRVFTNILRLLDQQVGKTLIITRPEIKDKEPDELITPDKKPKLDLLRICVAAIPRLMTSQELPISDMVDMIVRYTIHVDEELRLHAHNALQNLITHIDECRSLVFNSLIELIQREITDNHPNLTESALKIISSLLIHWRNIINNSKTEQGNKTTSPNSQPLQTLRENVGGDRTQLQRQAVHNVEGLALVSLCAGRYTIRKLAVQLLREANNLMKELFPDELNLGAINHIDDAIPRILQNMLPNLPPHERTTVIQVALTTLDLQWLVEQYNKVWYSSYQEDITQIAAYQNNYDAWRHVLIGIFEYDYMKMFYPEAASAVWSLVFLRIFTIYPLIDPKHSRTSTSNTTNEQRSSHILTRANKKVACDRHTFVQLWQNYITLACLVAPGSGCAGTEQSSEHDPSSRPSSAIYDQTKELYKILVPLIRYDDAVKDIRESALFGLGHASPESVPDLIDEIAPLIKETITNKENKKPRRKRDPAKFSLSKLFHLLAKNNVLAHPAANISDIKNNGAIRATYAEYIDGVRNYLEGDGDHDSHNEIRLQFSGFIAHLINNSPDLYSNGQYRSNLLTPSLRANLFNTISRWGKSLTRVYNMPLEHQPGTLVSEIDISCIKAMSALCGCGEIFAKDILRDTTHHIYIWLNMLLSCSNPVVYTVAEETLQNLLRYNADIKQLKDWTIDKCFTGSRQESDICFISLVTVFTERDFDCERIIMLNLALLYTGCPRTHVREMASQLLQLLNKQFLINNHVNNHVHNQKEDSSSRTHLDSSNLTSKSQSNTDLSLGSFNHSRLKLSEILSKEHSRLTYRIFSEICARVETANPSLTHASLHYLSPWMSNIELHNPIVEFGESTSEQSLNSCIVLNNLFHITMKLGDDHASEIEILWQQLASAYQLNLRLIIKYMLIVSGCSPYTLLPYVKRIVVYISRKFGSSVIDELLVDLQSVQSFNFTVEKSLEPPFFRIIAKESKIPSPTVCDASEQHLDRSDIIDPEMTLTAEQGVVFAKKMSEIRPYGNSKGPHSTLPAQNSISEISEDDINHTDIESIDKCSYVCTGVSEHIPYDLALINALPRCFSALWLLCDTLLENSTADWTSHIPVLLHVTFLGFDHHKSIVYEHCKKALLSMIYSVLEKSDSLVPLVLSACTSLHEGLTTRVSNSPSLSSNVSQDHSTFSSVKSTSNASINTLTDEPEQSCRVLLQSATHNIVNILKDRADRPLWFYETVSVRQSTIHSLSDLKYLLNNTIKVFKYCLPDSLTDVRWSQIALHFMMKCPNRHYAGRSIQIWGVLAVPMSSETLSDIIRRLLEVMCDNLEEMQGFTTEILNTIQNSVSSLGETPSLSRINQKYDMFISTPNLKSTQILPVIMRSSKNDMNGETSAAPIRSHKRSTSVSLSSVTQRAGTVVSPADLTSADIVRLSSQFNNQEMGGVAQGEEETRRNMEERLGTLVQVFWLGVSLLESDYEYEYILAVNLTYSVLNHLEPDRPACKNKLQKLLQQLKWRKYPGLHSLLLKGLTSSQTCVDSWKLLSRLTLYLNSPVISADVMSFPVHIYCMLPYMVYNYSSPNDVCVEAAHNIVRICGRLESSAGVTNLCSVMNSYSGGSVNTGDSKIWTRCVVKYINDIYGTKPLHVLSTLLEILERGPVFTQSSILVIISSILNYISITDLPSPTLTYDLITTVTKFVEGSHHSEAEQILRVVVKSAATIIPVAENKPRSSGPTFAGLHQHTSFAETEQLFRRELPGKTLQFEVDINKIPYVHSQIDGLKLQDGKNSESITYNQGKTNLSNKDGPALSSPSVSSTDSINNWKRPQHSSSKVKERIINVLSTLGQRVVDVIKSPSVIFSQKSEAADKILDDSSVQSDVEQLSIAEEPETMDSSSTSGPTKIFDFLDEEVSQNGDDYCFGLSNTIKRNNSINHHHSMSADESPRMDNERHHTKRAQSSSEIDSKIPLEMATRPVTMYEIPTEAPETTADEPGRDEADVEVTEVITPAAMINDETVKESGKVVSMSPPDSRLSPPVTNFRQRNLSNTSNTVSVNSEHYQDTPVEELAQFLAYDYEDLEEQWRLHVELILSAKSDAINHSNYLTLCSKILKDTGKRVQSICNEISFQIMKCPSLKELSSHFMSISSQLISDHQYPVIVFDQHTAEQLRSVEEYQYYILELDECYTTFKLYREQLHDHLIKLKRADASANEQSDTLDNARLEAGMSLYKLFYQWTSLCTTYSKLIKIIQSTFSNSLEGHVELCTQITSLRDRLVEILPDLDESSEQAEVTGDQETVEKQIGELLNSQHTDSLIKAVRLIDSARHEFTSDYYGLSSHDNLIASLVLYTRYVTELKHVQSSVLVGDKFPANSLKLITSVRSRLNSIQQELQTARRYSLLQNPSTESITGENTVH